MGYDLPPRLSRGKRIRAVLEDENEADDEFWGQEFFKEEEKDENYTTEEEQEDVVDTDFDDTEEEEDENEAGDNGIREEPKKKKLLPPGAQKKKKPAQRASQLSGHQQAAKGVSKIREQSGGNAREGEMEEGVEGDGREKTGDGSERQEAPVLRHSTMKRREKAELERQRQEEMRNKRKRTEPVHKYKPLTQAEMLKEAAQTEIKNLESLQQLVAMEEETKKKALEKRTKYMGPLVRIVSKKVDSAEKTTMELCHMQHTPQWLLPQSTRPCKKPVCVITGLPARYRDPVTRCPYSSKDAYKEIRRRLLPHTL